MIWSHMVLQHFGNLVIRFTFLPLLYPLSYRHHEGDVKQTNLGKSSLIIPLDLNTKLKNG